MHKVFATAAATTAASTENQFHLLSIYLFHVWLASECSEWLSVWDCIRTCDQRSRSHSLSQLHQKVKGNTKQMATEKIH